MKRVRASNENDFQSRGPVGAILASSLVLLAWGCGESDGQGGNGAAGGGGGAVGGTGGIGGAGGSGSGAGGLQVPDTYEFPSPFEPGASSVSYGGQVFRHVLIASLAEHVSGLTARLDDGTLVPASGDVSAELDFFYAFDGETSGDVPIGLASDPPTSARTWSDLGDGRNLKDKIAGNDPGPQHVDWSAGLVGWDEAGVASPESLVRHWFAALDAAAVARANGVIPVDPDGQPIGPVHVTAEGRDLRELLQKFLLGAVAFSQGADDYLDDATDGNGLLTPNTREADSPHTALAHAWDEGFGYFGAARDYGVHADDALAAKPYLDSDGDGLIDLATEYCFGHSVNASKRDAGSVEPTDFSGDAWAAFLTGRAIIASAEGPLTTEQSDALRAERDAAVAAWEKAIAATVVHYVNDVLRDMAAIGTPDYAFADHAKHWSEMKGFALSFQFNPHSPLDDAAFAALHEHLGTAPALRPGELAGYRTRLLAARDLLKSAYRFAEANIGDEHGEGGW